MTLHEILNYRNEGIPDITQRQLQDAMGFLVGQVVSDVATASSTLVNITGLSFPVAVNEVFKFKFAIFTGSSSIAGIKVGLTFPSGATVKGIIYGTTTALTSFASESIPASGVASTNAFNTVVSQTGWLEIEGIIINGSNVGSVQAQALKVASGTATGQANSYFEARKVS